MKKEPKHPIADQNDQVDASNRKASANIYLKYSGMAFQMGFIILLGALGGRKLDTYFHTPKPWFTILFSLIAIAVALYINLKDFVSGTNNQPNK